MNKEKEVKKVKNEKKSFIKLKKGGFRFARVYEKDFLRILTETADKAYEEAEEESHHYGCCSVYAIDLETACQFAKEIYDKTIVALRKASYLNHHHKKQI
ncbi:MAG: hypothetical protein ACYDH1_18690 [Anaerolineaceae bacterium]